jgi:DNA-binding transcriptional MerR regulator/effector-binding domain-containing protein
VKKDLLSITQLAKLRKLTSETLRHYDRIGLIKPDYVDPKNNYRYYSIRQYEKLGTIKELRQLGMSIDCIADYFTNRNLKKSTNILEIHQKILQQEIKEKKRLDKILRKKIQFLNELSNLPVTNVISQEEFSDRYIITFDEPSGGSHEHAYALTKLEWYLHETAPILASDRVGVYADDSILQESEKYIPASPFIFGEKKGIPAKLRKIIPKGTYLCMYYQDGELEKYHESFEIIKDYMKTHNMVSNGHILQIYKIDVTLTSDPSETLMQIQVPIKKLQQPI